MNQTHYRRIAALEKTAVRLQERVDMLTLLVEELLKTVNTTEI